MIKQWRTNQKDISNIRDFIALYEMKWTFSTHLASHHNGSVESLIKTVKNALKKIVNERVLSEEEYRTVLKQVQELVNNCPLWPTDGNVEQSPITSNDLLRPKGLNRNPTSLNEGNPKLRYDYIQRLVSEWWKLWLQYFVPNLQPRSKWRKLRENVAVGDIVLVIDKDIIRGQWQMAVVLEVYTGSDGNVRSVKIKTRTGTYDRPITKLCLLLSKQKCETEK